VLQRSERGNPIITESTILVLLRATMNWSYVSRCALEWIARTDFLSQVVYITTKDPNKIPT